MFQSKISKFDLQNFEILSQIFKTFRKYFEAEFVDSVKNKMTGVIVRFKNTAVYGSVRVTENLYG